MRSFLEIEKGRSQCKKDIVGLWQLVMNHTHNPLKNIPNLQARHIVLRLLAQMWCIIFAMSMGSITVFGVSATAHALLISGIAITVATFKAARARPNNFVNLARGVNGKHE